MQVFIDSGMLTVVKTRVAASPSRESCGLLFGTDTHILETRAAANVAPDPARTFEIDPQVLIAALKAERGGGPRVIGCYHSHPSGDATPSVRDAAAAQAGSLWLILAGEEARLWRAGTNGFDEVILAIG